MLESRINRIARNIVIAAGNNVFDDYFDFYADGSWVIDICRTLIRTINVLNSSIDSYNNNFPVIQEYLSYLKQVDLDDMNTSSAYSQINDKIKTIKNIFDSYENQLDENRKNKFLQLYKKELKTLKVFINSYLTSCINIFKRRYVQDEYNVKNLLDTIHSKGISILNLNK